MEMAECDYQVRKVSFSERADGKHVLYAMALFSGISMEWPKTIVDGKGGKIFKFQANEVMEDFMVGKFSGYASFVEI